MSIWIKQGPRVLPLFFALCLLITPLFSAAQNSPRLILQITVDQLRGDLPARFMSQFGDGGFRYLWEHGVVYTDAYHTHANNETIVGHTTLATGATPAAHGMIGNTWLDRESGETVYNIEDARYPLLSADAGIDQQIEIDPTQRAARSDGRSPAAILVSTFSDELAASSAGEAKVFAVSVKDRGAVSMAGHAGIAYWFSKANGEFVSSSYYMSSYPDWVSQWNQAQHYTRFANTQWQLSKQSDSYLFGSSDDRPWEIDLAGFGRRFPHNYGSADGPYYTTLLTVSPAGDELTMEFAKAIIENENIGADEITDYLSVSLSSTDYVGHLFGPSSLEAEDNMLRLDRQLADLFIFIDENIGLENTLIVLAADHGAPDTPGYSNSLNIPGGYVRPETWDQQSAIERLKQQFDIRTELIAKYQHPYIYLSQEIASRSDAEREIIERAVAKEIALFPEVSLAISSRALEYGNLPDTELVSAVLRNFHPKRSGDIYVVFKPNWFINDMDGLEVASTHGSPWRYDSFVPVVFAGASIRSQQVHRRIATIDIARTLSAYLGIKPPSGATGSILEEVLLID